MNKSASKLPQPFLDKLKKIYPQEFPAISNTFLQKKTVAFRINYLKTNLTSLRRSLQENHLKCTEVAFPSGAFILKSPLRKLQETEIYKQGLVYVQNLSSMLPVIFLDPQNGEKILDLCAAPGAKTTQIASLAPKAEIIAVEKIRGRYYKLLANLKQQGASQVKVHLLDGTIVRKKFPEKFDKILLDSPCSSEGRFFIANPKSYKYWKPKKVKEMAHKQKKLLAAALEALKEGGSLVYSTCTMSPEENEEVIDWAINRYAGQLETLPLKLPLAAARQGRLRWKNKVFSPYLGKAKRIIPNESLTAFFLVKIKKSAESRRKA